MAVKNKKITMKIIEKLQKKLKPVEKPGKKFKNVGK